MQPERIRHATITDKISGEKIVRIYPSDVNGRPLPLNQVLDILQIEFPDTPIEKLRMLAHPHENPLARSIVLDFKK